MNTESTPTVSTVTEADVVAFLAEKANHVKATFGPDSYASCDVHVLVHSKSCNSQIDARVSVGCGSLSRSYSGGTFADAMKEAGGETKEKVAAAKRAEAQRLIREADEIDPASQEHGVIICDLGSPAAPTS